jgi:hypothetical protein
MTDREDLYDSIWVEYYGRLHTFINLVYYESIYIN